jgi:hypothetical protein
MKHTYLLLAATAIFLTSCVAPPPKYIPYADLLLNHRIEHTSDNRTWVASFYNHTPKEMISQWALAEEQNGTLSEVITYRTVQMPAAYTAQQHMDYIVNQISPNSTDFKMSIIKDTPDDVMFEWSHKGMKKARAQREICRIIRGSDGLYSVAYTVVDSAYNEERYQLWSINLDNATLQTLTPEKRGPDFEKYMAIINTVELHRDYDLYIVPYIPENKVRNARKSCMIPANESICALIDSTSFGSAKNCLVIGTSGIFINNDWSCSTPGRHFIPYTKFKTATVQKAGWFEIAIGGIHFNTAAVTMSNKRIVALLEDVQTCVRSYPQQQPVNARMENKSLTERLKELQKLKDEGLITDTEYELKRKSLIDSI